VSVSEKTRNGFSSGRATIEEPASAKINLFLHVGMRRADGFHPLQSLAVFTVAGDVLRAEAAPQLSLALEGPFAAGLRAESDNLVLRAARALAAEAGTLAGASLTLTKNLPVASGIGGGSADAAAALRGLNAMWNTGKDPSALCKVAAALGSDIPVCVVSGPSFMEGRGEILRAAECIPRIPMLLVNPGVAVPTRDVFAALKTRSGTDLTLPRAFADASGLLDFLSASRNDLEEPARALQPVIGDVLDRLAALPGVKLARMSGSGATCFALFADAAACDAAAGSLRRSTTGWWIAPTVTGRALSQN